MYNDYEVISENFYIIIMIALLFASFRLCIRESLFWSRKNLMMTLSIILLLLRNRSVCASLVSVNI